MGGAFSRIEEQQPQVSMSYEMTGTRLKEDGDSHDGLKPHDQLVCIVSLTEQVSSLLEDSVADLRRP